MLAQTDSSHPGAKSPIKNLTIAKTVRGAFAALISAGLVGVFALPAYSSQPVVSANYASQSPQTLTALGAPEVNFAVEALAVGENVELIESELAAEAALELAAEEERQTLLLQQQQQQQQQEAQAQQFSNVPAGASSSGVLGAAYGQLGVWQDCTALVENSLRSLGYSVGDLGTGIWQYDGYGVRVSLDSLQPGDILIYGNAGSGAHVAIYAGDGQAVHGGFPGGTVVAGAHAAWEPLTGAIRPR